MKPNKFLLGAASILLMAGTCVAANAAHAGSKEREAAGKEDGLTQGVPHPVTLTNQGNRPLKEIEIRFSGADGKSFRQTNDCGEELKANASCTINVTFLPQSPGPKSALMEVHTSGGDQLVHLSGTGI